MVVTGIIILYGYYLKRKNRQAYNVSINTELRYILWGFVCFYGSILLDSVILQDILSINRGLEYTSLTIPFFVFYALRTIFDIDSGTKIGVLVSCGIIFVIGIYQWYQAPNERIMSTFAHPNHLATMVAMTIPLIAYFFKKSSSHIERIELVLLLCLGLFCIYLTGSRGGLIALVIGVSLSILTMLIVNKNLTVKRIIAAIAIIVLWCAAGMGIFYHLQGDRNDFGKHGGERLQMVEASYQMWNDHKLFGVGLDRWGENYYDVKYHPEDAIEQGHTMPHNMPMYFFSTTGLIGGIGYLLFHGILFAVLLKDFCIAKNKWLVMVILSISLSFCIQGFVDTTIINKIPARIYFGLLGYGMAAYRKELLKIVRK